jgi:hypothetical protein
MGQGFGISCFITRQIRRRRRLDFDPFPGAVHRLAHLTLRGFDVRFHVLPRIAFGLVQLLQIHLGPSLITGKIFNFCHELDPGSAMLIFHFGAQSADNGGPFVKLGSQIGFKRFFAFHVNFPFMFRPDRLKFRCSFCATAQAEHSDPHGGVSSEW